MPEELTGTILISVKHQTDKDDDEENLVNSMTELRKEAEEMSRAVGREISIWQHSL